MGVLLTSKCCEEWAGGGGKTVESRCLQSFNRPQQESEVVGTVGPDPTQQTPSHSVKQTRVNMIVSSSSSSTTVSTLT